MTDATDDLDLAPYKVGGVIDRTDYFWTTRDGKRLNVMDMETSHIKNCIRMLERTIDSYPGEQVYMGDSYNAEQAVESENRLNEDKLERLQYSVRRLEAELMRRGEVSDLLLKAQKPIDGDMEAQK